MPAKISRNKDGSYKVSTPNGVHAKGTSLKNARSQQRLLNAIDHGFKPEKSNTKSSSKKTQGGGKDIKAGGVTCAICGGKHKTVSHAGNY